MAHLPMNVTQFVLRDDPELQSYIEGLTPDKVVLGDYYYSTEGDLFSNAPLYSEKQIGRILNLTDTEYSELVHRYVTNAGEKTANGDNEIIQKKINDLEHKVKLSREYEDAQKLLNDKESELSFLQNELTSVDSIQAKYNEALQEYSSYGRLTQFNLSKMHLDLVRILEDITRTEEELLETKGEQIRRTQKEVRYDKGKIGLAVSWTVALGIVALIMYLIKTPMAVIVVGVAIGLLLTGLFLYTAKVEAEYPLMDHAGNAGTGNLQAKLQMLQAQKNGILQLVGIKTTDDFFHLKAKLGSCVKTLKYLKDLRETALQGKNFEEMQRKRQMLDGEVQQLKVKVADERNHLKSEDYLATYRQIDSLKLQLGQLKQNINLDRNQIVSKLASIRKELEVKLPGYKDLLKNNFKASYIFIKKHVDELVAKLGIKPIDIDADGFKYGQLNQLEKVIINYALIKNIYKQNFVFAIENPAQMSRDDYENLLKLVTIATSEQSTVYLLDEKKVS